MRPINETPTASCDRNVDCRCGQPVELSVPASHCSRCGRSLEVVLAVLVLAA